MSISWGPEPRQKQGPTRRKRGIEFQPNAPSGMTWIIALVILVVGSVEAFVPNLPVVSGVVATLLLITSSALLLVATIVKEP